MLDLILGLGSIIVIILNIIGWQEVWIYVVFSITFVFATLYSCVPPFHSKVKELLCCEKKDSESDELLGGEEETLMFTNLRY